MPCRSSSDNALACILRGWSASIGGSKDHRPLTMGGPAWEGRAPRPKLGRLGIVPVPAPRYPRRPSAAGDKPVEPVLALASSGSPSAAERLPGAAPVRPADCLDWLGGRLE